MARVDGGRARGEGWALQATIPCNAWWLPPVAPAYDLSQKGTLHGGGMALWAATGAGHIPCSACEPTTMNIRRQHHVAGGPRLGLSQLARFASNFEGILNFHSRPPGVEVEWGAALCWWVRLAPPVVKRYAWCV